MTPDVDVLRSAADRALAYAAGVDDRVVTPTPDAIAGLTAFDEPFPDDSLDAGDTIELLDRIGGPATMGTTGPNYFGFVNGATYPVALGAAFIADAWDQNAALPVMSPVAAKLYDVSTRWLIEALHLPEETDVAYVTGATVANASCLAAARDAQLAARGWDSPTQGLFGAPPIQVVVGGQVHSTIRKSLGLVGLGSERVTVVPADDQGRMRADLLPDLDPADGPIVVCAQAGEVNTGAFDPFDAIADWTVERDAWMHVDGAFGLWALADPSRADLVKGLDRADSWATDGHKWLNVTYDCGIAFVRRSGALRRTFASVAGYLPPGTGFEAMHHTPQSSQRARQVEVWAVLRTLGRAGLAAMVQQASDAAATIARRLGDELGDEGLVVLNDVVLNQVLVRFEDPSGDPAAGDARTDAVIAAVQSDGTLWLGGTRWHEQRAMRISVSGWNTTEADVDASIAVIRRRAEEIPTG